MKRVETAIVIGGGIAGLTTALALGRLGIDVKVFEQADVNIKPSALFGISVGLAALGGGASLWLAGCNSN